MNKQILIYLASIGTIYLAKDLYYLLRKAFVIMVNAYGRKYDFVVCNEKKEIAAFVILKNKNATQEEIESIGKTLKENHNYQLYQIRK